MVGVHVGILDASMAASKLTVTRYPTRKTLLVNFGQTIFLKVDLIKGYNQIPICAMGIPKAAVITSFGLFEFLCTPFGLANVAQAFQQLMDLVLQDLTCVYIYLDKTLVASSSPSQHLWDLTAIFDRLEGHGLVIHPGKHVFGVTK